MTLGIGKCGLVSSVVTPVKMPITLESTLNADTCSASCIVEFVVKCSLVVMISTNMFEFITVDVNI